MNLQGLFKSIDETVGTVSDVILDGAKAYDAIANGGKIPSTASNVFVPIPSAPTLSPSPAKDNNSMILVAGALLVAWFLFR